MDIGAVLTQAWQLYTRFFTRFVAVAAVVYVVLGLVNGLLGLAAGDGWLAVLVWTLISLGVTIVGFFWLQGALVETVRDVRDGRVDVPLGELYARTRPRLPALISAGVLAGIGIFLGLLLLIVPGLFLLTRWLLIAPVIVLEGRSAGESFTRSSELVRGESWNVFAVILLTVVTAFLAAAILGGLITAILSPLPDLLSSWIANVIVNSVVAPWVALSWTVVYFHLAELRAPAAEQVPVT